MDQGADYSAYGNAENIDQQNNENMLAENEQDLSNASSLASLAGSAAGDSSRDGSQHMSNVGGDSGKDGLSGLDTNLQQGNFEFGPSQFDQGAIDAATQGNQQTTTNRYDQLGMGGSTPELQDLANQANMGQATTGQEQTQDVTNPAFNPALQTAQTNIPTTAVDGRATGEPKGGAAEGRRRGRRQAQRRHSHEQRRRRIER